MKMAAWTQYFGGRWTEDPGRQQRLSRVLCLVSSVFCLLLFSGCSPAPRNAQTQALLTHRITKAVQVASRADPGLQAYLQNAAGYAVFPSVSQSALGLGGAYGRGELFEGGRLAGFCAVRQTGFSLALGGQTYTELIFFENHEALERFKSGQLVLAEHALAVAIKSGSAARARYADGVAVFSMAEAGLFYEAAVAGQKFDFQPI
jgi:lipid-binding SYLF domain-containing protein